MRLASFTALLATLAVVLDAKPLHHVLHERRPVGAHHLWSKKAKPPPTAILPVRIGLTQQNLDRGEEFLLDVSDPTSTNYGRHWTPQKIADTFAPRPESVDAVLDWLDVHGHIGRDRIRLSRGRHWVEFNATVAELERLLHTEYHVYEHTRHGRHHVACEEYHVPAHLRDHIDLVLPTVQFHVGDGGGRHEAGDLKKRELDGSPLRKRTSPRPGIMGRPSRGSMPKQGAIITNAMMDLSQCGNMITPSCLRALYNMPVGSKAHTNNSIGIVEYTPQAFLQSDLDLYFAQFARSIPNTAPDVKLLDNAVVQTTNQSFSFNGESALDLEFAMALVAPQRATLFQVGDETQGASFNNLLDGLDASYCTFAGGDDPTADAQYNTSVNCGTATATHVLSTSYSFNEADLTPAYERRQCAEYLKLGLQGVSVIYSSGDNGVAGNSDTCIDPTTGALNDGTSGLFNPSFPGTCPYVTSVGATQLRNGSSVRSAEVACETVIYSGGGFSNVFSTPSYQKNALARYYTNSPPSYGSDRYNNSQAVRGFPDVSANGANYLTAVGGSFTLSYGTSASAPTFAALLNLINEQRLAAGKSPVGFVNPALYANPKVLTDITAGSNPGCGTDGFTAVTGWDPLTGLGTPDYRAMEALFLSLP